MKMKIGAMNNPARNLYQEIEFIAENFDFLDLTLELPESYPEVVDTEKVLEYKKKYGFDIVGHTPWNLPIASPYEGVREAAYDEYIKCLKVFKKLKVKHVNAHPSMPNDLADPEKILQYNIDFFKKITAEAKKYDIKIMMENVKGMFNELEVIAKILKDVPSLKLHWDVGHANLGNEGEKKTKLAFHNFGKKIVHVHLSDNNGQEDQHLPLGTGNISWQFILQVMAEHNYHGTVTLEIHTPDLSYMLFSRDKLKYLMKKK